MHAFLDKDWNDVVDHLKDALPGDEAAKLAANPTAKLVAAIPYLAGSEDPDRFAVSNLLTLWGAGRAVRLFGHRADDDADPFRRLATFHVGSQADPLVVDYGLTLLALVSLRDHVADRPADQRRGRANPVASGAWRAAELEESLQKELDQHPNLKTAFAAVADEALVTGYWQAP